MEGTKSVQGAAVKESEDLVRQADALLAEAGFDRDGRPMGMSGRPDPVNYADRLDARPERGLIESLRDEHDAPKTLVGMVGYDDPGIEAIDDLTVLKTGRIVTIQRDGETETQHAQRHRERYRRAVGATRPASLAVS